MNGPFTTGVYGDDPLQDRAMLVFDCRPTILHTYREAIEDGMANPVVIVLDCKDRIGGHLARRFIPAAVVNTQVAAKPKPNDPVPVCLAFPYSKANTLLHETFPDLKPEEFPPQTGTGVYVAVVASGGLWAGLVEDE